MPTNEELQREVDRLKGERRAEDIAWRSGVNATLGTHTGILGEIKKACETCQLTICQDFVLLKQQHAKLQTVVCGETGKEKEGLTTRVAELEESHRRNQDARSRGFWLTLGAFLMALFAMGKDWILKHI
jgi:hypothetical protein